MPIKLGSKGWDNPILMQTDFQQHLAEHVSAAELQRDGSTEAALLKGRST